LHVCTRHAYARKDRLIYFLVALLRHEINQSGSTSKAKSSYLFDLAILLCMSPYMCICLHHDY
jgi:hypothetical protein